MISFIFGFIAGSASTLALLSYARDRLAGLAKGREGMVPASMLNYVQAQLDEAVAAKEC